MASYQELALFSLSAYAESGINRIDPPAGWTLDPDLSRSDSESGFAADVYRRGSEIVIAFRGTDDDSFLRGLIDGQDWANNIEAAVGLRSRQIELALEVTARALKVSGDITFTGHSLGGGLAGIMSVFFNRPATVFATAPFEHSARDRSQSSGSLFASHEHFVVDYFNYFETYRGTIGLLATDADFQSYRNAYAESTLAGDSLFASRQTEVNHYCAANHLLRDGMMA